MTAPAALESPRGWGMASRARWASLPEGPQRIDGCGEPETSSEPTLVSKDVIASPQMLWAPWESAQDSVLDPKFRVWPGGGARIAVLPTANIADQFGHRGAEWSTQRWRATSFGYPSPFKTSQSALLSIQSADFRQSFASGSHPSIVILAIRRALAQRKPASRRLSSPSLRRPSRTPQ